MFPLLSSLSVPHLTLAPLFILFLSLQQPHDVHPRRPGCTRREPQHEEEAGCEEGGWYGQEPDQGGCDNEHFVFSRTYLQDK